MENIIIKLKRLFCSFAVRPSYEFHPFEGNQIMANRDVKKMQEQGWELAGEISTKFSEHGRHRMLIPLKRRL
jgi:hypothetical protein